jgi:hypothetical protein
MDAVYVAASEVAAGLAFGLARRYPQYAAGVSGLFASRAVPADAVLFENAQSSAARPVRPCVARDEKEANAKFVKRGARVCLVATRAIAPHAEILTFAPHDPPARPTRDAKIAYEHLRRAAFYGAAREEKQRSHERKAKRHARRALRAIARANDAAFGAAGALKCAECSTDPEDSPGSMSETASRNEPVELIAVRGAPGTYLCSKHFNARRPANLLTKKDDEDGDSEDDDSKGEDSDKTRTKEPPADTTPADHWPKGLPRDYYWEEYKSNKPYTRHTVAPEDLVVSLPPRLREERASAKERRERAQPPTLDSKYANALKKFEALGLAPHGMDVTPVRPSKIQGILPASLVPGQRIAPLSAQIARLVNPDVER